MTVFLLAALEELIKLGIALSFRNTEYKMKCIYVFAMIEGATDFPSVYEHFHLYFELDSFISLCLSIIVLLCFKSLHILTSYIYVSCFFLFPAVLLSALWHTSYNIIAESMPKLSLFGYISYSFLALIINILIAILYLKIDHRFKERKSARKR